LLAGKVVEIRAKEAAVLFERLGHPACAAKIL